MVNAIALSAEFWPASECNRVNSENSVFYGHLSLQMSLTVGSDHFHISVSWSGSSGMSAHYTTVINMMQAVKL